MDMNGGAPQSEPERALALRDFEPCIGAMVPVAGGDAVTELKLTIAEALAGSPRKEGGFRLEFLGPMQPMLPQAIYGFMMDGEQRDIFIVPLGAEADLGMRYEAVFY